MANEYVLLEPSIVPAAQKGEVNLVSYLQGAYVTLFVVIIASAVLSLVYFGFNYMISDIPNNKADALKRFQGVIWGLVIALTTVMILELINPNLIELKSLFG
ncbi:MAG: hypothetical protein COV08_03680 [Candidatus Vogelbacteria bacterium CG10_big_fil_rev_8_21_14_0_10_49_38]|uniref:Uncharacterized protein n=1 Tax=Candidatus Vogelbacteria bacterium CG10_big_fil_rev_8_21_14_0_10_49_38 TaxID=1975043 RepID=A0A2H0RH39_9BACT|nr:MAG: hypothetical protein BK006_03670 [bacterium CG10_49_38]PIR45736.1 MAG: hypothetical protein COV08_03680 [Candidatus Vogelbacteria bacterium CG10_big_fil_rev_8_21_14_0_10_49_38]